MNRLFILIVCIPLAAGCGSSPERAAVSAPAPLRAPILTDTETAEQAIPADNDSIPLELSIQEAVLTALENNRDLNIRRLGVKVSEAAAEEAHTAFAPEATASAASGRQRGLSGTTEYSADTVTGSAGLEKTFAAGTEAALEVDLTSTDSSLNADPSAAARVGIRISQPLLQGRGSTVVLAELRQAGLDVDISRYELHGYAMALTARIEETYWDFTLAIDKIDIYEDSLKLAQRQQTATREKIAAGRLPKIDLAAAQAETALRQEDLINAKSQVEKMRLRLLRLVNPGGRVQWDMPVNLVDQPAIPEAKLDSVKAHVRTALKTRPDLRQARLARDRDELEVVRTANGILPRLDLFIALGQTGYARSFADTAKGMDQNHYDAEVGLSLTYPSDRGARARYAQASLSARQTHMALKNMEDLVQLEVRSAYVEVARAREQVAATKATRIVQDEKLRAETEKFGVGRSTTILVAQTQRDSVESRIAEQEAVVNYLKAVIRFYLAEGSLLERRGIRTP